MIKKHKFLAVSEKCSTLERYNLGHFSISNGNQIQTKETKLIFKKKLHKMNNLNEYI